LEGVDLVSEGLRSSATNPLIVAVAQGNMQKLSDELKEVRVDVDEADEFGNTALMWAIGASVLGANDQIRRGNLAAVELLLEKGAKLGVADNSGNTALIDAAFYGNEQVVQELITAARKLGAIPQATIIDQQNRHGVTSLMRAAERGHLGIVEQLLNARANPNIKDHEGNTALDFALQGNKADVIAILDPITSGYWTRKVADPKFYLPAALAVAGGVYALKSGKLRKR
ncbi:MAG TPA: ankyrin repeat domain-containing protein, partial [Candidatus Babeliales bacterium]|nr:ankyrin repeat domain-containing protein [Candidatus Babeliales bacterium]